MGRQKGCSQAKKIFALGANMHREHFSQSEFIFMLVLFCYITQGAAGIADCDDARWDIARHDAACADHGIVPYRHAGQHRHARADPDVIADGYRQGDLKTGVALLNIQRVPRGGEAAVRRNEHMVAEGYGRAVKYHKIVI